MKYVLLKNEKGVITSRQPEVVKEEMRFEFQDAPAEAVAVFDGGERTYYRELSDGICSIPPAEGSFHVTVAVMSGSLSGRRWSCESIRCTKLSSGEILIAPDDADLPAKMTEIFLECDSLRERLSAGESEIARLREQMERLMEGYDIT